MKLETINPATGKIVNTYDELDSKQIAEIIDRADATLRNWRRLDFARRSKLMKNAAQVLDDNQAEYAELMTIEMGKPIRQSIAEVEKCAWVCRYYAEHAESFLQNEIVETDATKSFVTFNPLGVILAVMPWNFPFWQVFRFAAPALMAGNVGLLKHASNVCGCSLAIESVFKKAGFPEHVFTSLLIGSRQVASVLENKAVKAVTLTGSTPAGRAIASRAGQLLKKSVLELGGSDPYIILHDADLPAAAETCVNSRLINSGQSCIAAKRFIVVESVYDEFLGIFTSLMKSKKSGDPHKDDTDIGPLARYDLRDELHQQVQQSVEAGAACILGGSIPDGEGAYYPPTILTGVGKGMSAFDDELFGPVAAIIKAKDEEEAIRLANDSSFGLGAAVFSKDRERAERLAAEHIQAGCCFVNSSVKSDPRLPFGGIKESGYGRELSHYGIKEFVNIKSVYVA
jgi:succinate-semialdehyde dehydrogenase/glutarate-semialdehyde dehydrogenase